MDNGKTFRKFALMKRPAIVGWLLLLLIAAVLSCKKDKPAPAPGSGCPDADTANITYNGYVAGVMRQHCTGCHGGNSPSGSVSLETYQQVRANAERGDWYRVMINGSMPPGGRLDDCTLARLKRWIDLGYPE